MAKLSKEQMRIGREYNKRKRDERAAKKQAEIDAGLPVIVKGQYMSLEAQQQLKDEEELQKRSVADGTELEKYIFPKKREIDTYMLGKTTREVISALTDLTGYTEAEASFWFDAVTAVIFFELANERDFRIPMVGTLKPYHHKHARAVARTGTVLYPWVRVKFDSAKELRKRYQITHPPIPKAEYLASIPIDEIC